MPIALPSITQQLISLLRESLTNIERHAPAMITLTWLAEILAMALADDGAGIDLQDVRESHYGVALYASERSSWAAHWISKVSPASASAA